MLLVGLLMLVATPVSAQSDQPQQLTEGVTVVDLTPGDVREVRFTVDSATAAMLSWSCSFCEVEVTETDPDLVVETHGGNMLSVHADQNRGLTATISSDSTERVEFLLLTNITASEQTQRPAPGATTELLSLIHISEPTRPY